MTETEWKRIYTTSYINRDPLSVALVRKTLVDDGYGGNTSTETTKTAQTMRLVRLPSPAESVDTTGMSLKTGSALICEHDADIAAGDRFTSAGSTYEVVFVRVYAHKTEADVVLV